jgi:hypothetical protein
VLEELDPLGACLNRASSPTGIGADTDVDNQTADDDDYTRIKRRRINAAE